MRPQRQQERHRHGVQHRPTARSSVKPFASPCPPHLFVKMEQHGKHAAARKHAAATCEQHTATWKAYGSNMRAACSNMEGIRQQHASSMRQHGRHTAATCKQHAASNMEGIRQQHASSMQQHGRHTATTCEQHAATWKAYGSNMRAACSNMEGIRQQHASNVQQAWKAYERTGSTGSEPVH